MIDPVRNRQIVGALLYALVALVILLVRLLPVHPGTINWSGPNLTLCLTFAWILRRPEQLPALIIAAVFLLEDILLMRPLGLWAALAVLATEAARVREPRWREHPFMIEWMRVIILIALMMLAYRIAMAVVFLPLPSFGQMFAELLATSIAYPVVVLAARWFLGVRRLDITEAEMMRHR